MRKTLIGAAAGILLMRGLACSDEAAGPAGELPGDRGGLEAPPRDASPDGETDADAAEATATTAETENRERRAIASCHEQGRGHFEEAIF